VEEREVVIRRRNGEPRVGAEGLVVDERAHVAALHERARAPLETNRPVEGSVVGPSPRVPPQVVDDIAAAEDQDALVAQWRELPAELVGEGGRLRRGDRGLEGGR